MKRNTLASILMSVGTAGIITAWGIRLGYEEDISSQAQVYQRVEQLEEGLAECRDYIDSEKCIAIRNDYDRQMSNSYTSKALYDYGKEEEFRKRIDALGGLFSIPLWLGIGIMGPSIKPKEEGQ